MLEPIECPGFQAAGMAAGIKKNGAFDLGLICSSLPAAVAGVFTRNQVQAAPVLVSKTRVARGTARAVVVNSGNANCYTGDQGMVDAEAMASLTAAELNLAPEDVLVASTGVIGAPLPMDKIASAAPVLASHISPRGLDAFSRAIMTTDTVPKLVQRRADIDGRPVTLVAVAKGAGMIRPDMATMLCFVCTDGPHPGTPASAESEKCRGSLIEPHHRRWRYQHQRHGSDAGQRSLRCRGAVPGAALHISGAAE